MNFALTLVVAVLAGFFGTGIYLWLRAEMDERAWRKIMDAEIAELQQRLSDGGEL